MKKYVHIFLLKRVFYLTAVLLGSSVHAFDVKPLQVRAQLMGGVGISQVKYDSNMSAVGGNLGTENTVSKTHPMLGLRVVVEKAIQKVWMAGLSFGVMMPRGDLTGTRHIPAHFNNIDYKVKQNLQYDVSLVGGRWIAEGHQLYGRAGFVFSTFTTNINESDYISNKNIFLWGGLLGIGYEMSLNPTMTVGGAIEYVFFRESKNLLAANGHLLGQYKIQPSSVNFLATFSYKFSYFDPWIK